MCGVEEGRKRSIMLNNLRAVPADCEFYSFIDKELPWEALQAAGSNMATGLVQSAVKAAVLATVKLGIVWR